ncbi:MAG: V-type ATPase 116kDa subunit family protein [Smithella sp.]
MFIKSNIRKITIALEKVFSSQVWLELGKAEIIHLARFEERDFGTDAKLQDEEALTREIISSTEYALSALRIESEKVETAVESVKPGSDSAFVSKIKITTERAVKLRKKIRETMEIVARQMEFAAVLDKMGIDPVMIGKTRFLKTIFGTMDSSSWDAPSDKRFMIAKLDKYVFGLSTPADFPAMTRFLKEFGFNDKSADINPVSLDNLKKRAQTLQHRSEIIDRYLLHLKEVNSQKLQQIRSTYKSYDEMLQAMRTSLFSTSTMFITGWMDMKDKKRLVAILQGICSDRFILSERKDPDAPVRLLNVRWLKPFELLVKTMGMPSNSEIDPTPLAAITFVVMFGLMFGDLGQGLVLMMLGMALKMVGRKKVKENLEQAGGILIACGGSAAVCGLLYGSVFSSEQIIPALWFHPTAQIMQLFAATILMGVVFIMAGLCINILNNFLNADYTEALFEKRGLTVLILYAAVVVFALDYQKTGQYPAIWSTIAFILLPLFIFSFRGMLGAALFQKTKPGVISEYIVETVMDIVEIVLSLFANTISFIRVGAFALSHAGLSIVTYTLAGMADPAMKSAGAIIIIVMGNIFIIGFEGLICGIQSMRLEYYEFFGKFFQGNGVVFTPFTLKAKASEV